ncbi:MAG TPA: MlaD family protein, partial [Solirubrobacteraceae bacterium]|nr:MlaD family protein [Solirubrobacteraceae bacterium]
MRRVATVALLIAAAAAVVLVFAGAGDDNAKYKVRAIFENAGFVIPGEDVKVAGVRIGAIDSIEVTGDFKAAVVLDITDPGYQDF